MVFHPPRMGVNLLKWSYYGWSVIIKDTLNVAAPPLQGAEFCIYSSGLGSSLSSNDLLAFEDKNIFCFFQSNRQNLYLLHGKY